MEVIRCSEQRTSTWTGGTTTEIAIYPKDAVYSRRDFLWRISSATVEANESDFTVLPGFQRLIMVLGGELTLEHVGHHRVRLLPFEQDAFSGDWVTRSKGRATDFNVMLARGCTAGLQAVSAGPGSQLTLPVPGDQSQKRAARHAFILYGVEGTMTFKADGDALCNVSAGDAVLLMAGGRQTAAESVVLHNDSDAWVRAVVARIRYPGTA